MTGWIVTLIEEGGYFGIAFLMFLENVFPPIPSEIIMGLAGIEAGQGAMSLPMVVIAGTIGAVAGNYVWYLTGRGLGEGKLEAFVARYGRWLTLDHREIARASRFFARHGGSVIFTARFVPTIRTIISLPAGLFRMKTLPFLLWTTLGTAIWNLGLAYGGYELGRRITEIDSYTGPIATGVVAIIVVAYVWRVFRWTPHEEEGADEA